VEVRDREAELAGRLEAAARSVHADCWGGERVVGWEEKGTPILASDVWGGGRTGEDVVPFKNVRFGGVGDDVRGWVGLDSLVFAGQLRHVSDRSELGIEGQHTRLLAARVAMVCTLISIRIL